MTRQPTPPSVSELTATMLARLESAEVAVAAEDAYGDVQPHEVAIGMRPDPRTAWSSATASIQVRVNPPSEWGAMVARHESIAALPLAIGNYPQRVRDLGALFTKANLGELLPKNVSSTPAGEALTTWCTRQASQGTEQTLIAAALLRSAGDLDRARRALESADETSRGNELAALEWHSGNYSEAEAIWASQADSVAVRFNRGLAALFLGRPQQAISLFESAANELPDSSPWHHLANLYRTLAATRI